MGVGPVIFNKDNAYKYGQWIGNRYKDSPNIIWINGGDRDGGGDNKPIWDAIGEGIKSVDKNHLMTFHPWGSAVLQNGFTIAAGSISICARPAMGNAAMQFIKGS